jgi:hypothetical protein
MESFFYGQLYNQPVEKVLLWTFSIRMPLVFTAAHPAHGLYGVAGSSC